MDPTQTPTKKRTVVAWSLWDWGSAAWNAVITTFVFATWLTSSAFAPQDIVDAAEYSTQAKAQVDEVIALHSTWLSWATALAGVAIALAAPVLGARADSGGRRKLWLGINTAAVVLFSSSLFFITPDQAHLDRNVIIGLVILALGNIFFELASVNYNAMLNQISTPVNRGKISGIGWGAGYIGGIVLLLFLYFGFINPEVGLFGVTGDNGLDIRVSVLFAALWFALFAIPVFVAVPEKPANKVHAALGVIASYKKVGQDVAHLWRDDRNVLKFLFASAIFRDGLTGAFVFGGIIAIGTFGFTNASVLIFAILANVISGVATILFGLFEDRVGSKPIIVFSLIGMIVSAVAIFLFHDRGQDIFWIFGLILCIFVGPVQSASRATVSRLATPTSEGELFGLYAMTGRVVAFLSPALFGVLVAVTNEQRYGILGIAAILLLGLFLVLPLRLTPQERSAAHIPT